MLWRIFHGLFNHAKQHFRLVSSLTTTSSPFPSFFAPHQQVHTRRKKRKGGGCISLVPLSQRGATASQKQDPSKRIHIKRRVLEPAPLIEEEKRSICFQSLPRKWRGLLASPRIIINKVRHLWIATRTIIIWQISHHLQSLAFPGR